MCVHRLFCIDLYLLLPLNSPPTHPHHQNFYVDNDTDPDSTRDQLKIVQINDGDRITNTNTPYTIVLPSGAELTVIPATGEIAYDPKGIFDSLKAGEVSTDSFTYVIEDELSLESNVATVTIVINGSNDPPVAIDDDYTATITNPTVSNNILDNDFDIDVGDVISITKISIPNGSNGEMTDVTPSGGVISATFPSGGVVTINPLTGQMDYDAGDVVDSIPAGETFVETFTYQIVDTMGQTATATVTITIEGPPQPINPFPPTVAPPIAEDNSYARTVDQLNAGGGIITGQILENDSDPDGALGDLTITSITPNGGSSTPVQPEVGIDYPLTNGKFRINPVSGVIVYTPDPDTVAALGPGSQITDSFTYVITDKDGGTDIATVTFTIVGQNDPPVPEDDSETVPEGDDVSDCVL